MTTRNVSRRGRRPALLAALLLAAAMSADAAARKDAEACREVKAKIRVIQDRMRSGYTRAEGERLEARLRQLRDKRRRVCG